MSSPSKYDREHIPAILEDQEGRHFNWFGAHLIRLIAKADSINREKLRRVYPDHVEAYEEYYFGLGVWQGREEAVAR